MLEYFTYKKIKKNKEAKKAKQEEEEASKAQNEPIRQATSSSSTDPARETVVLDRADETFLERLLAQADDEPAPPLPPRNATGTTPELDWPSDDASSFQESKSNEDGAKGKGKETQAPKDAKAAETEDGKKQNRLSLVFSRLGKKNHKHGDTLKPEDAGGETEELKKEEKDMNRVLDRLNLSAKNNKVVSFGDESADLLRNFTQIFKDLANGVPTAYDDLVNLIKDRDGAITKGFEKLPSGLQKLVTQLPDKITASIAPEVLAAAAKSQGVEAAEQLLSPAALFELLTKPGALVGALRAIVATLQQRWPAFIGVNVLWSIALAILMFVLWYCYKRGRETRLEREKSDAEGALSEGSERPEGQPTEVVPVDRQLEEAPAAERSPVESTTAPK